MPDVKFRDGTRFLTDHIAMLMAPLDTKRMTYEEALVEMDRFQERKFINTEVEKVLNEHFRVR